MSDSPLFLLIYFFGPPLASAVPNLGAAGAVLFAFESPRPIMSIASALFAPAAPVSTGTSTAASGAEAADAGLFSTKMAAAAEQAANDKGAAQARPGVVHTTSMRLVANAETDIATDDPALIETPGKPAGTDRLTPPPPETTDVPKEEAKAAPEPNPQARETVEAVAPSPSPQVFGQTTPVSPASTQTPEAAPAVERAAGADQPRQPTTSVVPPPPSASTGAAAMSDTAEAASPAALERASAELGADAVEHPLQSPPSVETAKAASAVEAEAKTNLTKPTAEAPDGMAASRGSQTALEPHETARPTVARLAAEPPTAPPAPASSGVAPAAARQSPVASHAAAQAAHARLAADAQVPSAQVQTIVAVAAPKPLAPTTDPAAAASILTLAEPDGQAEPADQSPGRPTPEAPAPLRPSRRDLLQSAEAVLKADAPAPTAAPAEGKTPAGAATTAAPSNPAFGAKPASPEVASAEAPAPVDLAAAAQPASAATGDAARAQSTAADHGLGLSTLSRVTVETTAHLAAQIARRLEGRSTRFDMVLTPEDLGRVDVSLEIDKDGQLSARLAFDNPAAAADLRGRADELRRQLQDAGFQVAGDALDFSQRDPSAGGGAFERQQQRNALFAGGGRLAAQADAPVLPAPGAWTNHSLTPERVDLKV